VACEEEGSHDVKMACEKGSQDGAIKAASEEVSSQELIVPVMDGPQLTAWNRDIMRRRGQVEELLDGYNTG
jgi:hypothetical protein